MYRVQIRSDQRAEGNYSIYIQNVHGMSTYTGLTFRSRALAARVLKEITDALAVEGRLAKEEDE